MLYNLTSRCKEVQVQNRPCATIASALAGRCHRGNLSFCHRNADYSYLPICVILLQPAGEEDIGTILGHRTCNVDTALRVHVARHQWSETETAISG